MKSAIKLSTIRNLLILLIIVYFAQGALYPAGGSLLSQGALAGILTISAIYFFKTLLLKNNKNDFYIIWTLFLLVNLVGFLFTTDFSPRHVTRLKTILTGMLPFYPFYHFAQKGELKIKDLKRVFLAVLPLTLLSFYNHRIEVLTETGRDEMVNNVAYTFVYLMPFDFIEDHNRNPLIVEMSYGFGTKGISQSPGYWDSHLQWHEGKFNPQDWMMEDLIMTLKNEHT